MATTPKIVQILLDNGANPYAKMDNEHRKEKSTRKYISTAYLQENHDLDFNQGELTAFDVLLRRNEHLAEVILNHGIKTMERHWIQVIW